MTGELYVVGLGPGGREYLNAEADEALQRCDLIVGYTAYIKLIEGWYVGAELRATPMMREMDRCRMAFQEAESGRNVAMVCSGDAGVYGMASPILELAEANPNVPVTVVAGVTAAQSGSAVLGAPLSHDFAVISLSDLLTPWQLIERRLDAAASADFCVCLYNPRSKRRTEHLARAAEIFLRYKPRETVCGWVRNIGREGQESGTLRLDELAALDADMFTTVFVGNAATRLVNGRMVTPRGYEVRS